MYFQPSRFSLSDRAVSLKVKQKSMGPLIKKQIFYLGIDKYLDRHIRQACTGDVERWKLCNDRDI